MIVTFEELCELSKYRQAAAVKRWCKSQGISFMLDRNKRPQTTTNFKLSHYRNFQTEPLPALDRSLHGARSARTMPNLTEPPRETTAKSTRKRRQLVLRPQE